MNNSDTRALQIEVSFIVITKRGIAETAAIALAEVIDRKLKKDEIQSKLNPQGLTQWKVTEL